MATTANNGATEFARVAPPKQFCNLDRLLFAALERRGLDAIGGRPLFSWGFEPLTGR
jgi:hypothetical protein